MNNRLVSAAVAATVAATLTLTPVSGAVDTSNLKDKVVNTTADKVGTLNNKVQNYRNKNTKTTKTTKTNTEKLGEEWEGYTRDLLATSSELSSEQDSAQAIVTTILAAVLAAGSLGAFWWSSLNDKEKAMLMGVRH